MQLKRTRLISIIHLELGAISLNTHASTVLEKQGLRAVKPMISMLTSDKDTSFHFKMHLQQMLTLQKIYRVSLLVSTSILKKHAGLLQLGRHREFMSMMMVWHLTLQETTIPTSLLHLKEDHLDKGQLSYRLLQK